MKSISWSVIFMTFIMLMTSNPLIGQNLEITGVSPQPHSNNISRSSNILITFDQTLDGDSLIDEHVIVRGSINPRISGTITGGGTNILTFTPDTEYRIGERVSITITKAITSETAESLVRGHTYSFNVISGTPPSSPIAFAQRNIGNAKRYAETPQEVKTMDFDGDGDLDIITGASSFQDGTALFENDGSQNFCQTLLTEWRYVELHDLDGDGDLDAFGTTGGFNSSTAWYENEGTTPFTEHVISSRDPLELTGGDIDNDGDIDLVAITYQSPGPNISWFPNDGSGNFSITTITSSFDGGSNSIMKLWDVNQDGAMDVVAFYEDSRRLMWLENNGSQSFTEHNIDTLVNRQQFELGDLDDDGDLDIAIVVTQQGDPSPLNWYENDGEENFTLHSIPFAGTNPPLDVKLIDLDVDLDVDIIAGSYWFENDGSETFTQQLFSDGLILGSVPYTRSISFADLENDGDMDVITLGRHVLSWQENSQFMEITSTTPVNGKGDVSIDANISVTFSETIDGSTLNSSSFFVRNQYGQAISGTFNGAGTNTITFDPDTDFKPDERVEVSISHKLLSPSGHSLAKKFGFEFVVAPTSSGPVNFNSHSVITYNSSTTSISDVAISDIDSDGDLDIVSCSYLDVTWHENMGGGNFTNHTIPTTSTTSSAITTLDLNKDGLMDILVRTTSSTLQYLNDGSQNFTESNYTGFPVLQRDFDHDGDVDFLAANAWNEYQNQCDYFDGGGYYIVQTNRNSISVGDVDNDGDLDLLRAGSTGTLLDLNYGFENFFNGATLNTINTRDQALADLDSDGDLDFVVVENFVGLAWFENRLNEVTNDLGPRQGIGNLNMDPRKVIASDLDGDGDPDLIAISRNDDKVVWYENRLNETSADFAPESSVGVTSDGPIKILTADMDNDGDIDVVAISDTDDELIWYENTMISSCELPVVTSQPTSQTVNEGEDATFTASATGDGLSYQWQKDGVDITGAIGSTLSLTSVMLSDAGSYQCIVSNGCGDLTSDAVQLTVNELEFSFTLTNTTDNETVSNQQTTPVSFEQTGAIKTFQVTNTGSGTLNITSISSSDAAFVVSNAPTSVGVGSSESFTVTFAETQIGQYQETITITSNSDEFTFPVSGEITSASASFEIQNTTDDEAVTNGQSTTIDFGQVSSNTSKTFEITNTGETEITISSIISSDGSFTITDIPSTIAIGTSASFIITLSSTSAGLFMSTITISSSLEDFEFDVQGEVVEEQDLIVYNAVAPDGDGKHDFLKIENIDRFSDNSVQIFNRWGKKVYEVTGYDNSSIRFEGKSNVNGSVDLTEGTYYYIIELPSQRLTGFLFLRR